jgi:predicted helicase
LGGQGRGRRSRRGDREEIQEGLSGRQHHLRGFDKGRSGPERRGDFSLQGRRSEGAREDLHIGYETIEPWPLARADTKDEKAASAGLAPKCILKADKDHGIIVLDSETQLCGVPKEAFDDRLGNRSALEWILDQYKEKIPKDPTIREKFNTYRFADYKEKVVDLLARVTRVSVETQKVVESMRNARRPT